MKIAITGGAGFIGSHLIKRFLNKYPDYEIYNLDNLTYAGNLYNLHEIMNNKMYKFIKVDISDQKLIENLFFKYQFDSVIHLAAESHVDRSISNPMSFVKTNVIGTINLLNSFKKIWKDKISEKLFYHVSTDEVFGSLGKSGFFTEDTSYDPSSPYSASKAGSDFFVKAYSETYGLRYIISNCSNNYGEFQFPEKLIPLFINNIIDGNDLPVYGDGNYVRDWLYVKDHVKAIDLLFHNGRFNQNYNIGGFNEWKNIDLVRLMCTLMDEKLGNSAGQSEKLIKFVKDRPGHDKRYAIDSSKVMNEVGWEPSLKFEDGLSKTIDWYLNNNKWLENIRSGKYMSFYQKYYKK